MAKEPKVSEQSLRQQRFGGDFAEFQRSFTGSGTRPKEDVERDLKVIEEVFAENEKLRQEKRRRKEKK